MRRIYIYIKTWTAISAHSQHFSWRIVIKCACAQANTSSEHILTNRIRWVSPKLRQLLPSWCTHCTLDQFDGVSLTISGIVIDQSSHMLANVEWLLFLQVFTSSKLWKIPIKTYGTLCNPGVCLSIYIYLHPTLALSVFQKMFGSSYTIALRHSDSNIERRGVLSQNYSTSCQCTF